VAFGFIAVVVIWIHRLAHDPSALDAALVMASGRTVSPGWRRLTMGMTIVVAVLYLLAQVLIQPR
jgi:hypothetical protein